MVRIEKKPPIWIITLDRPDARNAVDRPTADELVAAFHAFDADPDARVAVFTGANGTFCAGADLKAIGSERGNRIDAEGNGPMGPSRELLSKPVIAAIPGYAVAGGLELALWCDLRVVEENATLGVFCRRWGVPLIDGGTVRLPRLIGLSRALDLILTGRPISATEALAMGLANRVVPPGQSRAAAEALALEITSFPQACMKNDRRSAYESFGADLPAALRREFELGMESLSSTEMLDGVGAFRSGQGRHGAF